MTIQNLSSVINKKITASIKFFEKCSPVPVGKRNEPTTEALASSRPRLD
jgi:hypothetical protein